MTNTATAAVTIPTDRFQIKEWSGVAEIMRSQVPTPVWMEIGAHNFLHYTEGAHFQIKAVNRRIRSVSVLLTADDLYRVGVVNRGSFDMYFMTGVFADQLAAVLLNLHRRSKLEGLLAEGWTDGSELAPKLSASAVTVIAAARRIDIATGVVESSTVTVAPTPEPATKSTVGTYSAPAATAPAPVATVPARPRLGLRRQVVGALETLGVPFAIRARRGSTVYIVDGVELTPGDIADRYITGGAAAALGE